MCVFIWFLVWSNWLNSCFWFDRLLLNDHFCSKKTLQWMILQQISHAGCILHIASPWVQIITYLSLCFHTTACQSVLPPPAQIGAVWKQPLPVPCGSNWLGLKELLYQWSWSESWAPDCRQPALFITLRNRYSCIQLLQQHKLSSYKGFPHTQHAELY